MKKGDCGQMISVTPHLFINTIINNIHSDGKNNSPLQDANTDKGGRA